MRSKEEIKEGILEEARRTAKENYGKPLGQTAFKKATGISPFERGRYWPKHSDMLKEAGFEPNEPWRYYSDELLIEKTIEKIRKYQRYPTLSELFVDINNGDDFPYHIFKKRSQPWVISKIIQYCSDKSEYSDIIDACKPIIEKLERKNKLDSNISSQTIGEVYLFKHGHYNQYRVGRTNDLLRRGREIRIQLPERAILMWSIKTVDPEGVETYWLNRFKSKQMNGDWFNLKPSDVKEFKSWKRIA